MVNIKLPDIEAQTLANFHYMIQLSYGILVVSVKIPLLLLTFGIRLDCLVHLSTNIMYISIIPDSIHDPFNKNHKQDTHNRSYKQEIT